MPTILTTPKALEGSTYVVTAAFTDAAGAAVVPSAITWTLMTEAGATVNSRKDVPVAAPAASINIVLSGADLPTTSESDTALVLRVSAIYDSTEGSNLPLIDELRFIVEDLVDPAA